jgi:protein TonB
MNTKIAPIVVVAAALLAGCTSSPFNQPATTPKPSSSSTTSNKSPRTESAPAASRSVNTSSMSLERYKRLLAQHISDANRDKIYPGNPQAMLRSVVVLKYVVDVNGKLISSDTLRSNGDSVTTATALHAVRYAAPFPPPPGHLLSRGRLEILETMLFNDDGRFQLRSIAEAQLDD